MTKLGHCPRMRRSTQPITSAQSVAQIERGAASSQLADSSRPPSVEKMWIQYNSDRLALCMMFISREQDKTTCADAYRVAHVRTTTPLTNNEAPPVSQFARPPTPLPRRSTPSALVFPLFKHYSAPPAPHYSRLRAARLHLPLLPFLPCNPSLPPHSARGGRRQPADAAP